MHHVLNIFYSGLLFGSCAFAATVYSVQSFTTPGQEVVLNKISDSGAAVGYLFPNGGGAVSAFLRNSNGQVTLLPLPNGIGQAYGINNLGQITGFAYDSGIIRDTNGALTLFTAPGSGTVYTS